jgi:hypothetical protein
VLVAAGVALGDGLGAVGVSLAGMLVAVAVAPGVTEGAVVGVAVVQAALIDAATIKTTKRDLMFLLRICPGPDAPPYRLT